ncbi:hypothetical protein BDB00DRAFT_828525 [Zychaea mexicana]|uniref:uncharacterized protein n=1 Tax=Zychaea mexicana TaxID=64656 RepID=UPI0022FEA886|nr:uncharacterized protein BDB00DRAFT_828525 [Zychaea mexicana]KAI9492501.1 hypothetical protein BDB00DRAFT_828525 [Zychaea mexicana]
MFKWALQKENKNRARYAHVERQAHPYQDIPEIQEVYDMLRGHPASAPTSEGFRNYIRKLSGVHRQ